MNSIDPVRDNAKDIDDDRRYPNAKVSDINQSGKLPGPAEDNENAPLLIGDNLNGPVSEEKPKQSIVRRTWSWGFKNRLIIGLIGLLVAGVVVLGVYLLCDFQIHQPLQSVELICIQSFTLKSRRTKTPEYVLHPHAYLRLLN